MKRRTAAIGLILATIAHSVYAETTPTVATGPRETPAVTPGHTTATSKLGKIEPVAKPPVQTKARSSTTTDAARTHTEEARIARDRAERVAREQHAHEDARIAHAMPESEADRMARVRAETEEARRYRVRAEEEAENARRIRAQAYAQDQEAARIRAEAAAEQADGAEAMAEAEAARAQELASVPVSQSGFTSPPSPTSAPRGIALDASNHPVDYEYAAQGYTKGVPNSFFDAGRPH